MTNEEKILNMLQSIQGDVKNMKIDIGKVYTKIDKLELRMENEIVDRLHALFDDRQVQHGKLQCLEDRLESIEIDTGYLVSRVSSLEKLVK